MCQWATSPWRTLENMQHMEETCTTNLAPYRMCPSRRHPSVNNRFCAVRSRSDIRAVGTPGRAGNHFRGHWVGGEGEGAHAEHIRTQHTADSRRHFSFRLSPKPREFL